MVVLPEGVSRDEIQLQLERVLASPGFAQSDRLKRFLRLAVERTLDGRAEELKEYMVGVEVFDRGDSFDPRADTIVRSEANRLRSRLAQYYQRDGRDDPLVVELPKGRYIPTFRRQTPAAAERSSLLGPRGAMWLLAVAGVVLVAGFLFWLTRPEAAPAPVKLTRLTSYNGLTFQPSLSSDGGFVAYASDQAGAGDLDVYVEHVGGNGEPVRLTEHPADDYQPSFSPDGAQIAFRSEREGGGIYVIPALGGEERLIAPEGRDPRFSPDGTRIAYWVGLRWGGKVFVAPWQGGQPREVDTGLLYARKPLWAPDGEHLLVAGRSQERVLDWWVAPASGGLAVSTGARAVLARHGIFGPQLYGDISLPNPEAWWTEQDSILFSAHLGDQQNLWRLPISAESWQVEGPPRQLTVGTGREAQVSAAAGGRIAFAGLRQRSDLWSLPIDANEGTLTGSLERLTQDPAQEARPDLSVDGKKLMFLSDRAGAWNIWVKDLDDQTTTAVTAGPNLKLTPMISPDGARVAYRVFTGAGDSAILVAPAGGGPARNVCEDCRGLLDWSGDATSILFRRGQIPYLLHVDTGEQTEVRQPSESWQTVAQLSPGDRWIAFDQIGGGQRQIVIAPFRRQEAIQQSEQIRITDGATWDALPRWSPDGSLLYFLSDRDGFRCVWTQRLDPATKRPVGSPEVLRHFHDPRLSLASIANPNEIGMPVAEDKLVLSLAWITGNVWMMETTADAPSPNG